MEMLSSSTLLFLVPTLTSCLQLWSGVLFWQYLELGLQLPLQGLNREGTVWRSGPSDIQVPFSTTLGSDFPQAPLPTNTWAPHWGGQKPINPSNKT